MATELFPPRQRTIAAVSHEFLWAIGGAILAGYAHLLRHWRHLQLVVSLPNVVAIVLVWSVSLYASQLSLSSRHQSPRNFTSLSYSKSCSQFTPPDTTQLTRRSSCVVTSGVVNRIGGIVCGSLNKFEITILFTPT